jgi:hypothetical protein
VDYATVGPISFDDSPLELRMVRDVGPFQILGVSRLVRNRDRIVVTATAAYCYSDPTDIFELGSAVGVFEAVHDLPLDGGITFAGSIEEESSGRIEAAIEVTASFTLSGWTEGEHLPKVFVRCDLAVDTY